MPRARSLLLALCALALGLALTLAVLRVTWRCGVEHEQRCLIR